MEIDGRDGDYVNLGGLGMKFASDDRQEADRWDDLLVAMEEVPELQKHMQDAANHVFGDS